MESLVPGGFGTRGSEGIIQSSKLCKRKKYSISWNMFWFSA